MRAARWRRPAAARPDWASSRPASRRPGLRGTRRPRGHGRRRSAGRPRGPGAAPDSAWPQAPRPVQRRQAAPPARPLRAAARRWPAAASTAAWPGARRPAAGWPLGPIGLQAIDSSRWPSSTPAPAPARPAGDVRDRPARPAAVGSACIDNVPATQPRIDEACHLQRRLARRPAGRRLARPGQRAFRRPRIAGTAAAGAGRLELRLAAARGPVAGAEPAAGAPRLPVRRAAAAWRRCRAPSSGRQHRRRAAGRRPARAAPPRRRRVLRPARRCPGGRGPRRSAVRAGAGRCSPAMSRTAPTVNGARRRPPAAARRPLDAARRSDTPPAARSPRWR